MFIDSVSDENMSQITFQRRDKISNTAMKNHTNSHRVLHFFTFWTFFSYFFHKNTALKHKSMKNKNMGTYFIVTYVKNPVRNWMTCENIFLSVLESLVDLSEIWYLFEPKIRLLFSYKKVLFTTYHFQFPAKTLNCFL